MSSDEDLRQLGNSIKELVEKVDQLQKYAMALSEDRSRLDPDHLLRYAAEVGTTTNMCKNSYENYIAKKR
jgi:tetrahydrodipicolinate N-succinyltransferase